VGGALDDSQIPPGWTEANPASNVVLCLDLDGNVLWQQYWLSAEPDNMLRLNELCCDEAGRLYLSGTQRGNITHDLAEVYVSVEQGGSMRWQSAVDVAGSLNLAQFARGGSQLLAAYGSGEFTVTGIGTGAGDGIGTGTGTGTGTGVGGPPKQRSLIATPMMLYKDLSLLAVTADGLQPRGTGIRNFNDYRSCPPLWDEQGKLILLRESFRDGYPAALAQDIDWTIGIAETRFIATELEMLELDLAWLDSVVWERADLAGSGEAAGIGTGRRRLVVEEFAGVRP
jgi:hypothetical protein